MFQVDITPYASDAIEDAMRLAQIKALNSFTFSDCLNYLNYAWSDIYNRVAMIDDGFYGQTVRLTEKLTHLPKYVKNTVQVYRAQSPVDHNRLVYREAGTTDIVAHGTYKISGFDLYCADVETYHDVWLYYVPACPQIFYTYNNRDPIIPSIEYADTAITRKNKYNLYNLFGYYIDANTGNEVALDITQATTETKNKIPDCTKWVLKHASGNIEYDKDITSKLLRTNIQDADEFGTWQLIYVSCAFPYIFCTYKNSLSDSLVSGFYTRDFEWTMFNPFDFTGITSNVEYIDTTWNDKTGVGVTIADWNDLNSNSIPKLKTLGWTPDTKLTYPAPEMYRYLVARLADKFAALNESNVMGVKKELIEARYAFEAFLNKNKSAWQRISNVNTATIGDWL